jgi:hypothetical protein
MKKNTKTIIVIVLIIMALFIMNQGKKEATGSRTLNDAREECESHLSGSICEDENDYEDYLTIDSDEDCDDWDDGRSDWEFVEDCPDCEQGSNLFGFHGDYMCYNGDIDKCQNNDWVKQDDCEDYSGYDSPCLTSTSRSSESSASSDCSIECSCSSWSNNGCGGICSSNQMEQTRTCTPTNCDSIYQCVDDSSCSGPTCNNPADSNTDCTISVSEVMSYAKRYMNSESGVTISNVMSAAKIYMDGGSYQ